MRQTTAENDRVFDRHSTSCRHVRPNGMTGIAHQYGTIRAPNVVSIPVINGPKGHVDCCFDHTTEILVESLEGRDKFVPGRGQPGALAVPTRCWDSADDVNFVTSAGQKVSQNMAVRSPPLRAIPHLVSLKTGGREDRSLRHTPDEPRRFIPKHMFTHSRPYAIRAYHYISVHPFAILKTQTNGMVTFLDLP